ncbi:MAG: hypothetical protein KJO00_07270 [Bacteroidia bacterium]|nr:hypothetical protein [Bacteroidia bacterium]
MKKILFLFLVVHSLLLHAQDDYISWSSFQLQTDLTDKSVLSVKPIFRHNENLSRYQNMSVDIIFKQNLGKGWSGQLLSRSWFIPDSDYRHFIFFDIANTFGKNQTKVTNRLRYHWAFEIAGNTDLDFFRWATNISFFNKKKLRPYVTIEPWLRADGIYQFQLIRYEPGIKWIFNEKLSLDFQYRIEKTINREPDNQVNVFVINLLYKI